MALADMPEYMKKVAGWEHTTTSVGANADQLPDLLAKKDRLEVITNKIKDLFAEHVLMKKNKQESMAELKTLLREGETLAFTLRTNVRQHYGLASEKLVEFGLKPNRPRSSKAPVPPGPEAPAPAEAAAATKPLSKSDSSQ
jgi:hypothetical protein